MAKDLLELSSFLRKSPTYPVLHNGDHSTYYFVINTIKYINFCKNELCSYLQNWVWIVQIKAFVKIPKDRVYSEM